MNSYCIEFLKNLRERMIKENLDIMILARLAEVSSMSGYDAIAFIDKKFNILISAGTFYSKLYSLERLGLLHGNLQSRKRVYSLSEKGREIAKIITFLNEKLSIFLNEKTQKFHE